MKGILGKKVGMTQVFTTSGKLIPVTVIEVEPNVVTQIKTVEKDGYDAIQLGYETVKRTGGEISGPVPLPTEVQKYTILRAVHKYKDSREQFEMRTHKRLIDIKNPSKETIDALTHLDIPSGVDIQIKL